MKTLNNIEALLITNLTNIRYVTGFVGVGGEREAYCLLTKDRLFLFTNSLYLEQAKQLPRDLRFTNNDVRIIEISREKPFGKELARVLKRSHLVKKQGETLQGIRLGFEETDLTVAEYNKLKKELKGVTLLPIKNRIEELRMIKREDEIENIRQAAKLTDECFDFILSKLKASLPAGRQGVMQSEIAWEIESFFRTHGASLAFPPIVAFGANSSQPHYSTFFSLKRSHLLRLKNETLILLDFGARVNGYCADMTRVVFIGKPKNEWGQAYKTVLEAQRAALEYLQAQRPTLNSQLSGSTADRVAREVIEKAGFIPYPHSLGHGVGLDIHEAPRLTVKKPNDRLRADMVVTVEPGVYIEGQYGIRIEDLVLLGSDGIEILSKSSKEIIIL